MSANFQIAINWLQSVGISVEVHPAISGFLGDLRIKGETILVKIASDELVGDLFHEAGHIAVIPSIFRGKIDDDIASIQTEMSSYLETHPDAFCGAKEDPIARAILQSGECEAIAWSYAAVIDAGIDSTLPFRKGFNGDGMEVHEALSRGQHLGIHGLLAGGMTGYPYREPDYAFPKMKRWMQI